MKFTVYRIETKPSVYGKEMPQSHTHSEETQDTDSHI